MSSEKKNLKQGHQIFSMGMTERGQYIDTNHQVSTYNTFYK